MCPWVLAAKDNWLDISDMDFVWYVQFPSFSAQELSPSVWMLWEAINHTWFIPSTHTVISVQHVKKQKWIASKQPFSIICICSAAFDVEHPECLLCPFLLFSLYTDECIFPKRKKRIVDILRNERMFHANCGWKVVKRFGSTAVSKLFVKPLRKYL